MFNSHHRFSYLPENVPKTWYPKQEMLKIKPATLQHYIVSKYFAPINESTAGPQKTKRSLVELLMSPLRDHLSRRCFQFVVSRNFITYHFMYSETNNNREKPDTLLIHYITSSKLYGKLVWVFASDVNVAVPLIAHLNLLSCRNVYLGVSAEKTNIGSLFGNDYILTQNVFWHFIATLVAIQLENFRMLQGVMKIFISIN